MTGHINIYGEIGVDVTFKSVKTELDKNKNATELIVHIHSVGGGVYEGYAIHDLLKYSNKTITVRIEGLCASIATVIAMAGSKRIMTETSQYMVHNPFTSIGGDSSELRKVADNLEREENRIAQLYASNSNLTFEDIKQKMSLETWFSAEEALAAGFITEIEQVRAVARLDENKFKNNNTMKNKDSFYQKVRALLKLEEIKNKVVQDANGEELDFYELGEDDAVAVGAKATVNGNPADGDYTMPSGDIYKFDNGELVDILKKVEEQEVSEDMQNAIMAMVDKMNEISDKLIEIETKQVALEASNSKIMNSVGSKFQFGKQEPKKNNTNFKTI